MILFFSDFIFLMFFLVVILNFWVIFITNNFHTLRVVTKNNDKLVNNNFLKKNNYYFFLKNILIILCFFYASINLFQFKNASSNYWDHFSFSSKTFYFINLIILFGVFCLIILYRSLNTNVNIDLIFIVSNVTIITSLLYCSSSFLSLFFVLEIISLLMLYKFSNSENWNKINRKTTNRKTTSKFKSKNLKTIFNAIFYQYWSTFFSSVLLIIFIINMIKITGTSEITTSNILLNINHNNKYHSNNSYYTLVCLTFLTGLTIKLGLTPINFFKIEIYKGLPYIVLFLYTTYYFLSFFLFFSYIFLNASFIGYYTSNLLYVILLIGAFYLTFLILDGIFIKTFLSFSTFVNTFNFFLIIVSSFN